MPWTAEAIEDLKRLALEGRSASSIAAALGVPSRNAVIGKASRIGIKLNGGGRAAVSGETRASARRAAIGRHASTRLRQAKLRRCSLSAPPQPGRGREAAWTLRRSRGRRDAAAEVRGHSRIRLSMAARRSQEWGVRLLRAHAGQGPVVLRRPLSDGLSSAAGATDCAGATRDPRHREFMAAILKGWLGSLEYADEAGSIQARFAPSRSRLDEQRPQAGLTRCRLDVRPAVGEAHRRLELESVALTSFDREREQAVRGQRPRNGGE